MKASYKWIGRYFEKSLPPPEKVAELLTMHSFEIESLDPVGDDVIFDVKVLPNRASDCLSHYGLAREIGSILDLTPKGLEGQNIILAPSRELAITVESAEICSRYIGTVIHGVKVAPSPEWLKVMLEKIGQRSINNVVDATNFVMFLTGQPLHAFDMRKLGNENGVYKIAVRFPKETETNFQALDGMEYSITSGIPLIIDDAKGAVLGLAGIKGGRAAEINDTTTDIVLESAQFDPVLIRKASKRLGLRTDASVRFEGGLSTESPLYGMRSAIALILELAGGTVEGSTDVYLAKNIREAPISVSLAEINMLLGTEIGKVEALAILKRLHFIIDDKGEHFEVAVPWWRLDLALKEDLIEEVGRLYGYERITSHPIGEWKTPLINKNFYYHNKVRQFLKKKGFSEVYTYAFLEVGEVEVANPLASDKKYLRKDLGKGLGRALEFNARYADYLGLQEIMLFEIGKVFSKGEKEFFSLALAYEKVGVKKGNEEILTVFFRELMQELGLSRAPAVQAVGAAALIELSFDDLIAELKDPTVYDLEKETVDTRYQKISSFPFALRDLAVFVPENINPDEVLSLISEEAGPLLARSRLFDTFKKTLPDGKNVVSYAFRLVFQSHEKTLTDRELLPIMTRVTSALNARDGWHVR